MKLGRVFLVFPVFLLASLAAHADTISTFSFSGSTIFNGSPTEESVNGSITIDVTTGIVQTVSFTAGGIFQSGVDSQSGPVVFVGPTNAKLSFDAGSFINFNGSKFDLNIPNDRLYVGDVTAGAVPSVAAITPEPASLLLLASGLVGVAGTVRRRRRAA